MSRKLRTTGLFFMSAITFNAYSLSSTVTLNGGGNVTATTSTSISLNGLVPSASYNVVCYITAQNPFQYVLLGACLSDNTSTIISYSLNGNFVIQDELMIGQNLVEIKGKFTSPSTSSIVITNLDQSNSFNVSNCFASAIQIPFP